MRSKEKGKILKLATMAKSLFILFIVLAAFGNAYADPMTSPLPVHKTQHYRPVYKTQNYKPAHKIKHYKPVHKTRHYKVKSETIRFVTAYNVGDPRQTDDTPCISANGEDICKALANGESRCAANFVPLGSRLFVDKIGVCLVTDRMNKRYPNRVDIAMQKDEYRRARRFGLQKLHVKILDSNI